MGTHPHTGTNEKSPNATTGDPGTHAIAIIPMFIVNTIIVIIVIILIFIVCPIEEMREGMVAIDASLTFFL